MLFGLSNPTKNENITFALQNINNEDTITNKKGESKH